MKVTFIALNGVVSLWVPDTVSFDFVALAAHLPVQGRGVELSAVFSVHEVSGSNDTQRFKKSAFSP